MPTFDDAAPNALRQEDVVDEYPGGNKVADPYRWLEDPDGADTVKWVEAQCKTTNAYLGTLEAREFLKERLTEKYNYAKTGSTFVRGKDGMRRYYFYKNDGLQNQYVMFSSATVDGDPELFFDPNKLASDGTKALGATAFAKSGKMWAYGVSASGSDWQTIYLRDIATKEDMKDSDGNVEKCEWVKFSGIAWLHDDSGFFYSRYPAPAALADDKVEGDDVKRGSETNANTGMMVYFHKVGTPQAEDKKIFAIPEEPKHMPRAEVTDDGEYVIITVSESTAPTNKVYWAKVSDVAAASGHDPVPVTKMIDNFDAGFDYITNEGTLFYFQTNKDAPRYKLITIDIARPTEHQDILPHHASNVLSTVVCTGEKYLVATYMQDAQQTLTIYDMSGGEVCKVALPDVGTVGSLSGRKVDMEFFYSFTGFVTPGQKFRFDLEKMEALKIREDTVTDHNPDDFETKQVFFESSDGTKVPMFIVGRRGQEHKGDTCTFLYGYGGFSISITPTFNPFRTVFMKHFDGILCIVNLRGGGEYGEEWHEQGCNNHGKKGMLNKQNTFTDFQCAAEYLIREGYTNPGKIAINGGSNGGLLVGACVNQRPDLYACAIPQVGVMDMLRFHKFTIGYAWCADYGCADNSEEEFKALFSISPLHNIKPRETGQYPAVLVTTADHDDRVVPLHSFKYAATLQHTLAGRPEQTRPLFIRIETKAGHGAGKPTAKVIEEIADIYAFIGDQTKTPCKRA